ncbi:hypothetical protein GOODEAATRI_005478 [Goodea atripinnis]|uniref:Leptin n=1 Tax=Goodea atripinnis TaxID=208336 RepID=A0ABV0P3B5_9TELE
MRNVVNVVIILPAIKGTILDGMFVVHHCSCYILHPVSNAPSLVPVHQQPTAVIDSLVSISWGSLSRLTHNLSKLSEQSNIMAFYVDQLAGLGCRVQEEGGANERSTVPLNHFKINNEG